MKKLGYTLLVIAVLVALYYVADVYGLIGGFLGISGKALHEVKNRAQNLDEKADEAKKDLKAIEKEKEQLEKDGVKDMTPVEVKNYWEDA